MIKNNVNVKGFDNYQMEEINKAQRMAEEVEAWCNSVEIIQGDNGRGHFPVIITIDGLRYDIHRDYTGHVNLWNKDAKQYYNGVSSSTGSEIRKRLFISNNIKVITEKKLKEKIAEINAYNEAMQKAQDEAAAKHAAFLKEVSALPVVVKYSYNWDSVLNKAGTAFERVQKEITGGEIVKNGIRLSFELGQDGYISKKLAIDYRVDHNIESFLNLSANNWKE